jgi:hypothetical protein
LRNAGTALRYFGCDCVHTPFTHVIPAPAPQQLAVVVHFSYSPEHAGACAVHSKPPSAGWQ